ncbi:MAG: helix-turn-helix transcriptional regulator [Fibrobacter sp.]|nr:helix-turn-helix transcriptional regulator [Fibrobacter sp.]
MAFFFFFDKDKALENFSRGFNAFLSRKNLKVKTVSEDLGLSYSAVSFWKNGRGFPDFTTLSKLFEMGMTLDEMFGEKLASEILLNQEKESLEKNELLKTQAMLSSQLETLQLSPHPKLEGKKHDIAKELEEIKARLDRIENGNK